jgi:hypothetical protein
MNIQTSNENLTLEEVTNLVRKYYGMINQVDRELLILGPEDVFAPGYDRITYREKKMDLEYRRMAVVARYEELCVLRDSMF